MGALLLLLVAAAYGKLPVVLWHGMGDDCCNPESLGAVSKWIRDATNGSFILSLKFGRTEFDDRLSGFFKPAWRQVDEACQQLSNATQLRDGFHAVGFSQGGQFLRALVQQCGTLPPVVNLVTLGGQHQGVFGLPNCLAMKSWMCRDARKLIDDFGPYDTFVQEHSTQSNYWHDADDEARYNSRNPWLPKANGHPFDAAQRKRLMSVSRFVMVRFENDTMVQPRASSHFGWYANGSDTQSVPLQQTALYTDPVDALGLRAMDKAGKLVFLDTPGEHLQFTKAWFISTIVDNYLM